MAEDLENIIRIYMSAKKKKTNSLPTAFQPARGKWRI